MIAIKASPRASTEASQSTIALQELHESQWDVVIIGAGVAGAAAAILAAKQGFKTLLVESKTKRRESNRSVAGANSKQGLTQCR